MKIQSITLLGLSLIGLLSPLLAQVSFQYAQEPNTPVVVLSRTSGEVSDPDPIPLLRIYGDGSVRVHFPNYFKRAGDYELQLSRTEMEALLASLIEQQGLIDFDPLAAQMAVNLGGDGFLQTKNAAGNDIVRITSELGGVTPEEVESLLCCLGGQFTGCGSGE